MAVVQVEELTDAVKRGLAEMENLRARTSRQIEQTQKFAVQVRMRGLGVVPGWLGGGEAADAGLRMQSHGCIGVPFPSPSPLALLKGFSRAPDGGCARNLQRAANSRAA